MTAFRNYQIVANNKMIGRINTSWDSTNHYGADISFNGIAIRQLVDNLEINDNKDIQIFNLTAKTKNDLFNEIEEHLKMIIPNLEYELIKI